MQKQTKLFEIGTKVYDGKEIGTIIRHIFIGETIYIIVIDDGSTIHRKGSEIIEVSKDFKNNILEINASDILKANGESVMKVSIKAIQRLIKTIGKLKEENKKYESMNEILSKEVRILRHEKSSLEQELNSVKDKLKITEDVRLRLKVSSNVISKFNIEDV